jgi:hypothetical protein
MFIFKDPGSERMYFANGPPATYIPTPQDVANLKEAGYPVVVVSDAFFKSLTA